MNTDFARIMLVEGIAGIGKSTLVDALLRKYVAENETLRTLVHLTQAHTYGPLAPAEDASSLTVKQNIGHLQNVLSYVSWLVAAPQKEIKTKLFVIIDTLHLTHCVRPGTIEWEDVKHIDQQLAALGGKLLFLQAEPKTHWERCISDRKDKPFITHYGKKFGSSLKEIHEYFMDEQQQLSLLAKRSGMKAEFVACEEDFESVVEAAYSFWMNPQEQISPAPTPNNSASLSI